MFQNGILSKCIQCNQCAFVCPHACIRPVLVTDEELAKAPAGFETKKATGKSISRIKLQNPSKYIRLYWM